MALMHQPRPQKLFRVVRAHGPYVVGDTMQPTGMYRQQLIAQGVIEEVKDDPLELDDRMIEPAPTLSRRGRPKKAFR